MALQKLNLTEILLRTPVGGTFYTETKDTQVASYANRAGVKVSTERILGIHAGRREITDLTRVTVIQQADTAERRKRTRT